MGIQLESCSAVLGRGVGGVGGWGGGAAPGCRGGAPSKRAMLRAGAAAPCLRACRHGCGAALVHTRAIVAAPWLQGEAEGLQLSNGVYEALIELHCKEGNFTSAQQVLAYMRVRASWPTLPACGFALALMPAQPGRPTQRLRSLYATQAGINGAPRPGIQHYVPIINAQAEHGDPEGKRAHPPAPLHPPSHHTTCKGPPTLAAQSGPPSQPLHPTAAAQELGAWRGCQPASHDVLDQARAPPP